MIQVGESRRKRGSPFSVFVLSLAASLRRSHYFYCIFRRYFAILLGQMEFYRTTPIGIALTEALNAMIEAKELSVEEAMKVLVSSPSSNLPPY